MAQRKTTMAFIASQVVDVCFDNSMKRYTYNCHFPVNVGDRVMVPTGNSSFTTVTVMEVRREPAGCYKTIVHPGQLEELQREARNRQRRFEIVRRLNEIAKEEEEFQRFVVVARKNKEAAALLKELRGLK